jgi:rRNA maturation RNase YbeY
MSLSSGKSRIYFQHEDLLPELPAFPVVEHWVLQVLKQECRDVERIYYVFLEDEALLAINKEYLKHDTYTDIITFPYETNPIEAEIYISVDRVRVNSNQFNVSVEQEALRVMIHGILHLCGWDDKDDWHKELMRKRENACLSLIQPDTSFSSFSPS